MRAHAARLKDSIEQTTGLLVDVSIGKLGQASSVILTPESDQARAVVDGFDWSDAAHDAWMQNQHPERKTLRESAAQAVADNLAFLADVNVTQAEAVAQIKALTRQVNRIIALLAKD